MTVNITVLITAPPSGLNYSNTTSTYYQNLAIANNLATVTGTGITYSVSPALPAGLTLNTSSGTISGTPTGTQGATAYTVTAANGGGSTTRVITITISVMPAGCSGSSVYSYQIAPDLLHQ